MDTILIDQTKIGQDEVNLERTQQLQNDESFKALMKWCFDNKMKIHENLLAPAAFGPLGIPGIAAKEDIPANTVIAAIPNKLLITLKAIQHGELQEIFKNPEDSELFSEYIVGGVEFNMIATFLIYERCKDGKSFFQPYFDTIQRSYTMYDWSEEEVKDTECPELIHEFQYYLADMAQTWKDLKECLLKYPQFFKEEQLTKEIFLWSYQLIMTRVFGQSLPCTCLVPFGDLFNHGNRSATHYVVNKKYEEDELLDHDQYKIKKHKIDLRILDDTKTGKYKVKGSDYHFRSRRFRFVKKHQKELPQQLQNSIQQKQNYLEDEPLREIMYEINASQLQKSEQTNIWDLNFFTTSATEENDTDEEQIEGGKNEYDILFQEELQTIQSSYKTNKIQQTGKANKKHNSSSSNFEDESFEEEEVEEEKEEEIKNQKEQIIQQDHKEQKQKNMQNVEQMQNEDEIQQDNQLEQEQQNKKIIKIEHDQYEYNEDSVSCLSDDSNWDWYETQQENTYFAVTTEQPVKKGEQIFLSYGRRTNKFLLQWYGFAYQDNLFDSIGFRMWIRPDLNLLENNIEETIIFRKFISESDWQNGFVMNNNTKIQTKDLTKEFSLKKGHLCEEFIVFLRIYLSSHYKGEDVSEILFTIPRSICFEKFVFSFALRIIQCMRNKYKTTIEEDEEILKDQNINYKKRFATVLKIDHKKLLDEHIIIVETVLKILDRLENNIISSTQIYSNTITEESQEQYLKNTKSDSKKVDEANKSFKAHYMHNFENFDNYRDILQERHKIKKYLEQLYIGKYKQQSIKQHNLQN